MRLFEVFEDVLSVVLRLFLKDVLRLLSVALRVVLKCFEVVLRVVLLF